MYADELERRGVVEVLDRKDRVEDGLQADALALLHLDIGLQEALEGELLDLEQIRNVDDRGIFEKFADARRELGDELVFRHEFPPVDLHWQL